MGGSTKQALLQALSAAEGAYISGQQLAEALGVSRAAVHKAAQALSAQGYALDSAPRRGYRLAGGDPFCAEAVGPYPAPIHIYDTLQSSNLTAKQLALGGAQGGICGTSNYNGRGLVSILDCWAKGDIECARSCQDYAQAVINVICHFRGNIVGGKRIMKLLGFDLGPNRVPFQNMTDEEEARMRQELEAIDFFNHANVF